MKREKPKEVTLLQLINEYHGQDKGFSWCRYIQRCIKHKEASWKTQPKKIRSIHMFVVKKFLDLVLKDIIDNNVQFDINLGKGVLLSLLIADRKRNSRYYKYRIEQRGHDFYPYAITSPKLFKINKRFVIFLLHLNWWKRLQQNILNGKEYEMAPTVKFNKYNEDGLELYRS